MLLNYAMQVSELATSKAVVGDETDGGKPELRIALSLFDMNVRRFFAFVAEEEKPIAVDAEDCRHVRKLRADVGFGQVIGQLAVSRSQTRLTSSRSIPPGELLGPRERIR